MADVCLQCTQWRKEQYWNAFPDNKHHFFKVMVQNFQEFLRIPPKFKTEFKGKLSEKVTLQGPSGNKWITTLAQRGEDFVLQNGWQKFVEDHSIDCGNFLVFTYIGDSSFEVLIFDNTACEKEDTYFVEPDAVRCCSPCNNTKPEESTTSEEEHIIVKQTKEKRQKPVMSSDQHRLKCQTKKRKNEKVLMQEAKEEEEEEVNDSESDKEFQPKSSGSKTRKWKKDSRQKYSMYYESNRRTVTKNDTERAFQLASKHSTERPSCKIKMKPSHVHHLFILTIPKEFADNCLPAKTQKIMLQVGSKTWPVKLCRRNMQCTLNKGWPQFVLDNNLEIEDICVLELAHTGKNQQPTTLDVHIFRAVEEIVPLKVVKPFQPQ